MSTRAFSDVTEFSFSVGGQESPFNLYDKANDADHSFAI